MTSGAVSGVEPFVGVDGGSGSSSISASASGSGAAPGGGSVLDVGSGSTERTLLRVNKRALRKQA